MMRQQITLTPRLDVGRRGESSNLRRRLLPLPVSFSVAVHLLAFGLVVALSYVLPRDATPVEPATVELLMVEQKGATPSPAGQPTDATPAPPPPAPASPAPTPPAATPPAATPTTLAAASPATVTAKADSAPSGSGQVPSAALPAPPLPPNGEEPNPP